jgi:hypothetical protein
MHMSHRFTSASKPAAYSLLTVVLATCTPLFQPLRHQRKVCHVSRPSCEPLYVTNNSHRKQEIFIYKHPFYWVPLPTKMHKRMLLFGTIPLKHGRQFDYRNPPLDMGMRVCFLNCHAAGLFCYLDIHIEIILRPLRLFYFHLRNIYWHSLIYTDICNLKQLCYTR